MPGAFGIFRIAGCHRPAAGDTLPAAPADDPRNALPDSAIRGWPARPSPFVSQCSRLSPGRAYWRDAMTLRLFNPPAAAQCHLALAFLLHSGLPAFRGGSFSDVPGWHRIFFWYVISLIFIPNFPDQSMPAPERLVIF